jgi:hypothetical protein
MVEPVFEHISEKKVELPKNVSAKTGNNHVCMYTYIYICIYIGIYVYVYICTHMRAFIREVGLGSIASRDQRFEFRSWHWLQASCSVVLRWANPFPSILTRCVNRIYVSDINSEKSTLHTRRQTPKERTVTHGCNSWGQVSYCFMFYWRRRSEQVDQHGEKGPSCSDDMI